MEHSGPSTGKVLLVEDDEGVRFGLMDVLEDRAGVRSAETLAAALTALAEEPFSLVIADLRVGRDLDAGKRIVEVARRQLSPVIVMSGLVLNEIEQVLGAARADAIVPKPFQLEELVGTIERFLALRRSVDSAGPAPQGGWTPKSAGREEQDAGDGLLRIRLGAGARFDAGERGRGVRVVEGAARVGETVRSGGSYLYLAPGQQLVAGAEGCVAVIATGA
jgi:CheY-like chemotaxis protein